MGALATAPVRRVDLERELADLRERYEPTHQLSTLACISNRIAGDLTSTTRWTGVSLGRLLQDVGLRPEATHLRIRSVDDFDEVVALDVNSGGIVWEASLSSPAYGALVVANDLVFATSSEGIGSTRSGPSLRTLFTLRLTGTKVGDGSSPCSLSRDVIWRLMG